MAFYSKLILPFRDFLIRPHCGAMGDLVYVNLNSVCTARMHTDFLCEFDTKTDPTEAIEKGLGSMRTPYPTNQRLPFSHVTCPSGHMTHGFLACDVLSACWSETVSLDSDKWGVPSFTSCPAPLASLPPSFECQNVDLVIAFSLVCNHQADCSDSSDEDFCVYPPCLVKSQLQCLPSKQCVPQESTCDSQRHCVDGTDETNCALHYVSSLYRHVHPPPAIVHFHVQFATEYRVTVTPAVNLTHPCPETHVQCADNGYCLPVFLRCNGVHDCPGREDEAGCGGGSYTCPGFYRCRDSRVCLHASHVCDDTLHCPQQDDEVFCGLTFPLNCTCHGLACTCPAWSDDVQRYSQLRYLDASGSGLTQTDLVNNTMLVYLSLVRCGITSMDDFAFPNLHSLDLSHNHIVEIHGSHLFLLPALHDLFLGDNPLISVFHLHNASHKLSMSLQWLDLSNVELTTLSNSMFSLFPNLQKLNLSNSNARTVLQDTFHSVRKLRVLDMRGCPMTQIPRDLLVGLGDLQSVSADNYKLCCSAMLPAGFSLNQCQAPYDEISSCDDLLRSRVYRGVLAVVAAVTLLGNLATFVSRVFILNAGKNLGFLLFVTNLSVSDFLMGLYLAMIGIADRHYQNSYLWEDRAWRHSVACSVAGFLSLLSSEVSAMIVCLITLDRFIVLRFPFSSLRFGKWSSLVACSLVWVVGIVLAVVPFIKSWDFYSQNGICIPLPVTRDEFKGHNYAFGIMIIFNFVLFMLIATGQAVVFLSIRASSMVTADSSRKSQDLRIARGLVTIVVSDFLCWFPIGLLGLLASQGTRVPGEVNVAMAIIVLPLNSALNPFLYNLNLFLQRRLRSRENNIIKTVLAQMDKDLLNE